MDKILSKYLSSLLLASFLVLASFPAFAEAEKDWTVLVYLNGNNNLDEFGFLNMNQMEQVGSNDRINIVVQWASLRNGKTQRVLVKSDTNTSEVTSPVIEDMGKVDMGDSNNLLNFMLWGFKNYPAKHYLVDVWNHGSGWRRMKMMNFSAGQSFFPTDISFDDNTGNSISTKQLGEVMDQAARSLGRKIDLYASDACLMGMAEIANELSDSVVTFAGSEEVEAAAGWPYHTILKRLAENPESNSVDFAKILTEEFVRFYNGGGDNRQDATFSSFDLSQMGVLNQSMAELSRVLSLVKSAEKAKVMQAARNTQRFAFSDYADLLDFLNQLESQKLTSVPTKAIQGVKEALKSFVLTNSATASHPRAYGTAFWLPTSSYVYDRYASKYSTLRFHQETKWGDTLKILLKPKNSEDRH